MSLKDGGPAFPIAIPKGVEAYEGMSLRDYFAAVALPVARGFFTINKDKVDFEIPAGAIADTAYMLADAMLQARSK